MNLLGTSTFADVPIEFTVLSKNPLMFFSFSVRVPFFNNLLLLNLGFKSPPFQGGLFFSNFGKFIIQVGYWMS